MLLAVLAVSLLGALYVTAKRLTLEAHSRTVEIAMDYGDAAALARSYNYNLTNFLVSLRRVGLTSLAISEELGGGINASQNAIVEPGQALIDQSRLTRISDPTIARLAAQGKILNDATYLIVYNADSVARYRKQLAIHFGSGGVHTLQTGVPTVFAIQTQSDYFSSVGLGIPFDQLALVRKLDLLLVPRLQNDEAAGPHQIDAMIDSAIARERAHTVVFFGLRNQVLGFPDNVDATAAALRGHPLDEKVVRPPLVFGAIEAYDTSQIQKGTEELAKEIPGYTTRVEAISKVELDKLEPNTIVARYLLGVRERNIRVVYLRPFLHQWGTRSIAATNVEIVRQIATGLRDRGFRLGPATPVPAFRVNPLVIAVISLAVPALVLLLLDLYGWSDRRLAIALFGLDLVLFAGALAVHHEMIARKLIALGGAIAFPLAAFIALAPAFRSRAPASLGSSILAGIRVLVTGTVVTFGGVLVVVGMLSTPLMMEEIDRFTGVKAVLLVPPVLVLLVYLFSERFGAQIDPSKAVVAPVRVYQLVGGIILLGLAFVVLVRSGNQSDIAPTAFELALRSHLTAVLSVRPRFKEFVVGFPALMLLGALRPLDKRRLGWLFALGIGIGLADVVDTFSHLHTALAISFLRVVNGAVIGIVVGAITIAIYRAIVGRIERFARNGFANGHRAGTVVVGERTPSPVGE